MLERLWWLSIVYGTVRGVLSGHRLVIVAGLACAYLGVACVAGAMAPDFRTLSSLQWLVFMLLGLSMWSRAGADLVPLSSSLSSSLALRGLRLAVCAGISWYYARRRADAAPGRSTSRMAQVHLPFAVAAALDALELSLFAAAQAVDPARFM